MNPLHASTSSLFHSKPASRLRSASTTNLLLGIHPRQMLPDRHPKYSKVEIMEMKYSRYLRAVLLESLVKKEQEIVVGICADSDVVRSYKERLRQEHARSLMEAANNELMEKIKHINSAENLIATYQTLTQPGFNERLEKLMNGLTSALDILPVVNSDVMHEVDQMIENMRNEVNSINRSICAKIQENKTSVAEILKDTKKDQVAILELNLLRTRLMSMKEMINDDYIQKLSNEKIPGSTFEDIFGQTNYCSIEELHEDASSETLKFSVSSSLSGDKQP